ncbi:DUF5309 domain-containing protein [Methylobacterium fujisawaense]|uniref:DUF5309 domain-containing protein n=1 Tax=Methylobacterium fujisawaense TaxID=107400 RepID=UPI003CE8D5D9
MATLVTNSVVHAREDLANVINNITPEETPVYTLLAKTKATNTRHEFLTETLNAPNAGNASVEGADFTDSTLTTPVRLGNYTQISTKVVNVSGTLQKINTAGSGDEFGRQVAKAGKELKRDIEAAIVGNGASAAGGAGVARKSAGMESWIATNVSFGTGGAVGGYNAGIVAAPTDGTLRTLTEAQFKDTIQKTWKNGGDVTKVIVGPTLKQAISGFTGNSTKYTLSKDQTLNAAVDLYVSDFGRHEIIPHRYMRSSVVIMFDPSLWAVAMARNFETVKLAKTADSDRVALLAEWTLESKNELGNGKIADVQP